MSQYPIVNQPPGPAPHRQGLLVAAVVVIVVLTVVSVVAVLAFVGARTTIGAERRRADRLQQQAAPADPAPVLEAGRKDVEIALTYDSSKLDSYVADVTAISTSSFVTTFDQSVSALRQASTQHPSASGKVLELAVRKLSGDAADLLVFADITTKSDVRPQPAVNRARLEVRLRHQGDRWLLDELKSV